MASIDEHGRPEPEPAVGEREMLLGYLEYHRATLEWKARGLDAAALAVRVGRSSMTLAGLLKHMAFVEDHWFTYFLHDRPRPEPWGSVDWKARPDWEWETALTDAPDAVRAQWAASVARSRAALEEALRGAGAGPDPLGALARRTWPSGEAPSIRWILVHMIEEYARHNGHADLLREAVDGQTGE